MLNENSLAVVKSGVIVVLIAAVVFLGFNDYIFARPRSGWLEMGGCCGGGAISNKELRQIGLEYYVANYGDVNVEAVVEDFGCHQEIHIYKEGKIIKRIGYASGELYEI